MKIFSFKKIFTCLILPLVVFFYFLNITNTFANYGYYGEFYSPAQKEAMSKQVKESSESGNGNFIVNAIIDAVESLVVLLPNLIAQFVIIPITDFITALSGMLLDNSIEFTIFRSLGDSGGSTNPLTAFDSSIKEVWKMIRDGINIVFIFTLLYIAIQRILGNFKKEIFVGVLTSAIFVNFSFFATRTIIDIGNIFTGAIYNQIEIKVDDLKIENNSDITDLVSKIFKDNKNQIKLSAIIRNVSGLDTIKSKASLLSAEGLMLNFVVLITSLIILFVYLYMSFLFIGRFVMLIFLMASSPIGFLFGSIPKIASYTSKWWDTLIKQIAVGPIFMFFILMVINISKNETLKTARTGDLSIGLIFNYVLIISTLITALKISKSLSGQVAGLAGKATSFVAGAAIGAVTGGTAMLGRQAIGRLAAKTAGGATGAKLQQWAAKGGVTGGLSNLALKGIKGTANASFDIRGSKTAQKAMGQMKSLSGGAIDIKGAMDSVGNFGKAKTGGYEEWLKNKNEAGKKAVGEYTDMVNEVEKEAEKKAQKDNKVKEKREAAKIAKEKLDRLDNMLSAAGTEDTAKATLLIQEENLAKQELDNIEKKISQTKNPVEISKLTIEREKKKEEYKKKKEEKDKILKKNADIQRLTSQKNAAEQDYNNKKTEKELAEEKTASWLSNEAEKEFISKVPSTNATKAAYEQAIQRIEQLRKQRTNNKDNFDNNLKTKAEYERDEAELQNQIKEMVKEADDFKAKGIKEQMKTIEDLVLQNRPKGDPLIDIVNKRRMKNDFKEKLKNKRLSLMTKEERKKMIEIIEEEEKDKNKK